MLKTNVGRSPPGFWLFFRLSPEQIVWLSLTTTRRLFFWDNINILWVDFIDHTYTYSPCLYFAASSRIEQQGLLHQGVEPRPGPGAQVHLHL